MKLKYILIATTILLISCSAEETVKQTVPNSSSERTTNDKISATSASTYIGSYKSVCGQIVDTRYARSSNGSPTFLNFDKPYPNHPFVVVIWGSDRSNFSNNPEVFYKGKDVCVDGLIETYKGKPQIIVDDPSQIN